ATPEPLLEPPLQEEGNFTRIFGKSAPQTDVLVSPAVNLPANDLVLKTEVGTGYAVSQNTNLPPVPLPRAAMTQPVSPSPAFEPALGYDHDEGATRVFK